MTSQSIRPPSLYLAFFLFLILLIVHTVLCPSHLRIFSFVVKENLITHLAAGAHLDGFATSSLGKVLENGFISYFMARPGTPGYLDPLYVPVKRISRGWQR